MQNPFEGQKPITGVKNIVVVASGKGGVGKSTVASNLAMAMLKTGKRVGLLDCDVYGPSVPRLFGTLNQKPAVNSEGKILPITQYGLKLMSIGFLVEENAAIVWRGPMLFKAIDQFLRDVDWGELDTLVIDLPPGTGDVQLTLAQRVPIAGAVIVATPQNIAFADVKKSIDMFLRVNVPILGLVENMTHIVGPNGEEIVLFPKGEINAYLDRAKIKKLASLPFYQEVAKCAEIGIPIVESKPDSKEARAFMELAQSVNALI